MATCGHLDTIDFAAAPSADGCEDCLPDGGQWVQLRRCQECAPPAPSHP